MQKDDTKVCPSICLMLHVNLRVSSMSHSASITEKWGWLRWWFWSSWGQLLYRRRPLGITSHAHLPELKLSCRHLPSSVTKFNTKFHGRWCLFTKSLNRLILSTHIHPPIDLIQSYAQTHISMSTKMCALRRSGEHRVQHRTRHASYWVLILSLWFFLIRNDKPVYVQIFYTLSESSATMERSFAV